MDVRVRLQLDEALGSLNRWFCSQAHRRPVHDPEVLVCYYVKSGGAADFARRFEEAMGDDNRYFCSEFYNREIWDPEVLWEYYMSHANRVEDGDLVDATV